MNRQQKILLIGIGIWASGLLVGANLIGYLSFEPSWPPWLLLGIGVVASIGNLAALIKMSSSHNSDLKT